MGQHKHTIVSTCGLCAMMMAYALTDLGLAVVWAYNNPNGKTYNFNEYLCAYGRFYVAELWLTRR